MQSKKLTLKDVEADITSKGYYNYLFDPEYPWDEENKYYKFTSSGLTILRFFLDHIEKNPKITLQELRTLFDESKQKTHFEEASCIDYLINQFTGKFSRGGGLWCHAYGNPTKEKQFLETLEIADGLGCDWRPELASEGYSKIVVKEFAVNIGIFTFSCESEIV